MYKYLILFLTFFSIQGFYSQEQQVIRLTPEQAESRFLEENLELIAEHMNIDVAEAAVIQARLWENPSFSLGDVNLWTTRAQRRQEQISPLFGNFARHTEFTMELNQLIQTAKKRGKLIQREQISKEIAVQEFEEILRGLKLEVRKSVREIIYFQSYQKILSQQEQSLKQLISSYKNQVALGNIAKKELIRLQASLLELNSELYEIKTAYNEQQKTIKILLNIDPEKTLEIEEKDSHIKNPDSILLTDLLDQASENRPDVKKATLQIEYFEKELSYEKAQRVPDVTLSANYDRAGAVWKDYVGFGISFDLPVFNRNQGNIRAAQLGREQSKQIARHQENLARQEVTEMYNNYYLTYHLYKEINDEGLSEDLDFMLDAYTRNLMNRNISMLEYMDFMETYKINKQTVLQTRKNMFIQFEELQYAAGSEIR